MSRFDPPSIAFRGKLAQAMNQAYQQRQAGQDYSGRMRCPHCGSTLPFTVLSNGLSRGSCSAGCGIRWSQ